MRYSDRDSRSALSRRLSLNLIYSAISQGSIFVFSFVYYAIISRKLGPDQMGIFSTFMLVPFIVARFGHLGFDAANMHFITKQDVDRRSLFANSILLTAVVTLICTVIVLLYSKFDGGLFLGSQVLPVAMIALVALAMFRTLFHSILVGENRLRTFGIIGAIDSVLPLIGTAILWLFGLIDIITLVIMNIIAMFSTAILIARALPDVALKPVFDAQLALRSVRYGWKSWLNNLANQLIYKGDVFLIAYFLTPDKVGFYIIAVIIIEKAWYFSGAISNAVFPVVSGIAVHDGARVVVRIAKLNFWFVSLSCIVIALISRGLITVIFSNKYIDAVEPMLLLIPGIIFLSIPKVLVSHLAAVDRLEHAVLASVTACIVNFSLNMLLIPLYGINGAAIASSCSYFIYLVIYIRQYSTLTSTPVSEYFLIRREDFLRRTK